MNCVLHLSIAFLLLLFVNDTQAGKVIQRISAIHGPEGCVPTGKQSVRGYTETTQCPCLMRHSLQSGERGSASVDFLVLRAKEFSNWKSSGFSGQPTYETRYSTVNATSSMYSFTHGGYFFSSGNMILPDTGDFILAIRTASHEKDCLTQVQFVFESSPIPCETKLNITSVVANSVRVVGGVPAGDAIREASAVVRSASGECSASVIGSQWLLTAAHCNVRPGARARIGGFDSAGGALYVVHSVVTHPSYFTANASGLATHDVAVLRLTTTIKDARPLALNADEVITGSYARAVGYGQIAEGWIGHARARELRRVDVPTVDMRTCRTAFQRYSADMVANALRKGRHLCAGYIDVDSPCKGDTCTGDSGGPLVMRKRNVLVQVGITSGGLGCARPGLPGVYVNVAAYAKWIVQVTSGVANMVGRADAESAKVESNFDGLRRWIRIPVWGVGIASGGVLLIAILISGLCWWRNRRKEDLATPHTVGA